VSNAQQNNKSLVRSVNLSLNNNHNNQQQQPTIINMANTNPVTHVYLRSKEHEWIPALQLKSGNGQAKVAVPKFPNERDMLNCAKASKHFKYNDNQVVNLSEYHNGVLPMANVDSNGNLDEYKDMVNLPFMHEVRVDLPAPK
jgi:hypothetical protein